MKKCTQHCLDHVLLQKSFFLSTVVAYDWPSACVYACVCHCRLCFPLFSAIYHMNVVTVIFCNSHTFLPSLIVSMIFLVNFLITSYKRGINGAKKEFKAEFVFSENVEIIT